MLDPQKCGEILLKHFEEVTTEEFLAGLKQACPYLFEEDELNGTEKSNSSVKNKSNQHQTFSQL